ncbi:hypothetical protein HLRTI_002501 [Halorhabdus tiamatea SARL4B]|nr:hypothetical protein HLRTI_002501 [Halorhabdus tiamatea SARL4B]
MTAEDIDPADLRRQLDDSKGAMGLAEHVVAYAYLRR